MIGYTLRRTAQALVVLLAVTVITFLLLHALPGGPARALLGAHYSPGKYKTLNHQLGLDKPLPVQYILWLWNLMQGNLGYSYVHQTAVRALVGQGAANSALLGAMATLEAIVVAMPLGVLQVLYRRSATDRIITTVTFVLYSMPLFFIGTLAILYLAVRAHIFPAGGVFSAGATSVSFGTRLHYALLPSLTLALVQMAVWSRYMRSSMLDVMVQDYIRTARAKGLSIRAAIWKHGFRNALLPVITLMGLSLPTLIGGVVVVESVFNYPGMGYLLWQGAQQYDYPVVLGVTLVAALATVVGNWLADLVYAIADPRIHGASG